MDDKKKIIVSLDGISQSDALRIAKILFGRVWGFKVNDLLFTDVKIIRRLKKFGKVFADAKLHDIPNTVAHSVSRLSRGGADFITVHASGGIEMMKAAKKNAGRSKILAVTVLTSSDADFTQVAKLVQDSIKSEVDGIICSGRDLLAIKKIPKAKSLLKIVPGIRPNGYIKKDDQKRIMTPVQALELGADYLVIGRPILESNDPLEALENIFK